MRIQILLLLALYQTLPALSQIPDEDLPRACINQTICLLTDTTPDPSKEPLPEIITLIPASSDGGAESLNATFDPTIPSLQPNDVQTLLDPSALHPPTNTSTLIRIGFTHALNYDFLLTTPAAVSQIYTHFPTAIAEFLQVTGFDITREHNTSIQVLQSYDARLTNLNYRISLVYLYVPTYRMTRLRIEWARTNDVLEVRYNKVQLADQLLLKVDKRIPLTGGMLIRGSKQESLDGVSLGKSDEKNEKETVEGDQITQESHKVEARPKDLESTESSASPTKQVILGASLGGAIGILVTSLLVTFFLFRQRRKKQPSIDELDDMARAELDGRERAELENTERRELEDTGRAELEGDGVDELDGKWLGLW